MKEIPTLFSGPMVVSILENRKTQTRRPVKLPGIWNIDVRDGKNWPGYEDENGDWQWAVSPFGNIGDVITISEAVTVLVVNDEVYSLLFAADGKYEERFGTPELIAKIRAYKRPQLRGVFLPPDFQRDVKLPITDIRVQRVQEISEEDAMEEGCSGSFSPAYCAGGEIVGADGEYPSDEFGQLWDSIYGTWDANPWVWVATFEVVK